ALGSALLLPIVPSAVAGAGLTAFSGGLLGLYARTPGMRKENSPFPTQQGIALAKDVWMMGIGLGLVIDDLTAERRRGLGGQPFVVPGLVALREMGEHEQPRPGLRRDLAGLPGGQVPVGAGEPG